jgi:hypothetical protein
LSGIAGGSSAACVLTGTTEAAACMDRPGAERPLSAAGGVKSSRSTAASAFDAGTVGPASGNPICSTSLSVEAIARALRLGSGVRAASVSAKGRIGPIAPAPSPSGSLMETATAAVLAWRVFAMSRDAGLASASHSLSAKRRAAAIRARVESVPISGSTAGRSRNPKEMSAGAGGPPRFDPGGVCAAGVYSSVSRAVSACSAGSAGAAGANGVVVS